MLETCRVVASLCLLSSLAACGCSSDADEDADQPSNPATEGIEPRPVPGCEDQSYNACDVETEACQEAIFSTAACLRGNQGAVRPPSRTITVDDYRAELTASLAPEQPESEALLAASERCLVLLHLANAGDYTGGGAIEVQTSTVPAYYDDDSKSITFVRQGGSGGLAQSEVSYVTLLHEYVHALQDQEHDLNRLKQQQTTFDSTIALRAVLEGEAEMHEDTFLAAIWGLDPSTLDESERFVNKEEFNQKSLAEYSPITAISRSFPYTAGGAFMRQIYRTGGMAAIRARYGDLPTSTLEIRNGIEAIPVVADPPVPAEGYSLLQVDTFGAELFLDFLSATFASTATDVTPFASDWRGDRVYFYDKPGTEYVTVIWRIKLATESLRTLLQNPMRPWQSRIVDGDVVLALTTDPAAATVLPVFLENVAQGKTVAPTDPSNESNQAAARWLAEPKWRGLSALHGPATFFITRSAAPTCLR